MKQQKKNWPAESNMTALKTLSHTLLHLDIQPTKMSPLVVKHPFTDSGLAGIYAEDGSLSVGNLLDSPDALRTWRENFSRRINEAETAMNLFCMITKPYQFGYRKEDIRRGDIYYADLRPVVGSEQGGIRPVVILQNNVGNRHSPTVIAAAITSRKGKHKLPTHVNLDAPVPGLYRDSIILLEQLRTIDKSRLRDKLGSLGEDQMCKLDHALEVSVGLLPIYNTI